MPHYYCKRCGRIYVSDRNKGRCDCCGSDTYPVPEKYWYEGDEEEMTAKLQKLLREELVKTSDVYDEDLFNRRDRIIYSQGNHLTSMKAFKESRAGGGRFSVECPYCHATNVRKVSLAGRAVSAGIFGLGSKKIGKQWHCNRCGSDF